MTAQISVNASPAVGRLGLGRLSLNQATIKRATVPEAVDASRRAGLEAIGLWREPVAEFGLEASVELLRSAGLRVSSLCRGGFFTGADDAAWAQALAENRRAIDEAAALGAPCLVLVVGGLPSGSKDLAAARARMAQAVAELAPYAGERGVRLALEPLHPMYCADRAVLSTLGRRSILPSSSRSSRSGSSSTPSTSGGIRSSKRRSPGPAIGSRATRCATGSRRCRRTTSWPAG